MTWSFANFKPVRVAKVTDDLGVIHRIWAVEDTTALNRVREHLAEKPIFIADGHHRYETAVNYRNALQSEGKLENEAAAANFVLMMFVGMDDPGLAILPTHRLISGLPDLTADEIREVLAPHFIVEDVGTGAEAAKETWELMDADGGQDVFGFGTAADGKWLFARINDASPMAELAAERWPWYLQGSDRVRAEAASGRRRRGDTARHSGAQLTPVLRVRAKAAETGITLEGRRVARRGPVRR